MNGYKSIFVILCMMLMATMAIAQDNKDTTNKMQQYEDTLVWYADSMLQSFTPGIRGAYVKKFITTLRDALEQPNSFQYPFDRLATAIHILYPEDKSFRIFNWVFVASEFQRKYFGAIQMNSAELKLYPLIDKSEELEDQNNALGIVDNYNWYGGEMYNITTSEDSKGKFYNIFSYNNNAYYSKKKILDILTFTANGPLFGAPIIHTNEGTINRLILEYKKEAYANLNYSKDYNKIVFDRLASEMGETTKRYTFVPTGMMDGLEWKTDGWYFVKDAIPVLKLKNGEAPIDGVIPRR